MNIDEFLDSNAQVDSPTLASPPSASTQRNTADQLYAQLDQALDANDAQAAIEIFARIHDAIMREHDVEHNPQNHKLLAMAHTKLTQGINQMFVTIKSLVSQQEQLLTEVKKALGQNYIVQAKAKYQEAKNALTKFPKGFDDYALSANMELEKVDLLITARELEIKRTIHAQNIEQIKEAVTKAKALLDQNQIAAAHNQTKRAHDLYSTLPIGLAYAQADIYWIIIALDYQLKMKTTIYELNAYSSLYQIQQNARQQPYQQKSKITDIAQVESGDAFSTKQKPYTPAPIAVPSTIATPKIIDVVNQAEYPVNTNSAIPQTIKTPIESPEDKLLKRKLELQQKINALKQRA